MTKLLRLDLDDPGSLNTMQGAARAINELAERGLIAMVEPFLSRRVGGGVRNDLSAAAVARAITIASGLGGTSAYTWLKVPVVEEIDEIGRALEATTLPTVLLGGEVPDDPGATQRRWREALARVKEEDAEAKKARAVQPTVSFPPQSPGGAAAVSDTSEEFLRAPDTIREGVKIANVVGPTQKILLVNEDPATMKNASFKPPAQGMVVDGSFVIHDGRVNVGFIDGHLEAMKDRKVRDIQTASMVRQYFDPYYRH